MENATANMFNVVKKRQLFVAYLLSSDCNEAGLQEVSLIKKYCDSNKLKICSENIFHYKNCLVLREVKKQ